MDGCIARQAVLQEVEQELHLGGRLGFDEGFAPLIAKSEDVCPLTPAFLDVVFRLSRRAIHSSPVKTKERQSVKSQANSPDFRSKDRCKVIASSRH